MSHLCMLAGCWQNICVFSETQNHYWLYGWEGFRFCVFPQTQYCQYFFSFCIFFLIYQLKKYKPVYLSFYRVLCTFSVPFNLNSSFKGYLLVGHHLSSWGQTVSHGPKRSTTMTTALPSLQHASVRIVWGQIQSCNKLKTIHLPWKAEKRGTSVICILAPSGLSYSRVQGWNTDAHIADLTHNFCAGLSVLVPAEFISD